MICIKIFYRWFVKGIRPSEINPIKKEGRRKNYKNKSTIGERSIITSSIQREWGFESK